MSALLLRLPVALAVALIVPMATAGLLQQIGGWNPVAGAASLLVGLVLGVTVARRLPTDPPAFVGGSTADASRIPALVLLVVCVGFGAWVSLTHGEHVVVRRDPGAYATYALSLATFGGVPLDPRLDAFGLAQADPWVRVSSAANYGLLVDGPGGVRQLVSPQFLVGMPSVLSLGWWAAGWTGLFAVPAVVASAALAAFAALATLVVGPRWAVLAAALLAVSQPFVLVSRQTFSEPLSMLYLFTAATVALLAVRSCEDARRSLALGVLAGVLLGANLFVRIDAYRELVLLLPLAAVLVGMRHPAGRGLLGGAAMTALPASLATVWWSSPYVADVDSSLTPLLSGGAVLAVLSAVGVLVGRWLARRWAAGPPPWVTAVGRTVPGAFAGVLLLAGLLLASRPLWLVDRREPYINGQDTFVEALQTSQGLVADGTRTYAEASVTWLVWWVGPALALLALAAAVVATRRGTARVLAGSAPGWLLPLAIAVAVSVLALYRPAITPDHPWADRRYVSVTLPAVILLATVATAWLVARAGAVRSWAGTAAGVALVAALVLPTVAPTLPMVGTRTELGQVDAVESVCRTVGAVGERPAVIAVGFRARVEWTPVVRARCGAPLIGLAEPATPTEETIAEAVSRAAAGARAAGYDPVLLVGEASTAAELGASLGLTMEQVVDLETTEPERLLIDRPTSPRPLVVQAWVAPLP